ncbi:MAG: sensor histidine kinase [Propionibacteriaceae bacterium]
MTEFLHILPFALLACVVSTGIELGLIHLLRRRSAMITITVLVTVPLVSVLIFVILISGFMFTEQLRWTLVTCVLIGITVIPLAIVLGRRITRRQLEEEGRRATERAQEGARRELVAWVSHDLRTPLAGIRAMSEALEDGMVDSPVEVVDYGRRIGAEANRLTTMVSDLFELSKITAGALSLQLENIDLAGVVGHVVDGLTAAATRKGVRLEAVGAAWPEVLASGPELDRVLRKLVVNAIRHTPASGVVRVVAESGDDHVRLQVSDSCGGISAEDLPRVFDVAYRGTVARTPEHDHGPDAGAGLGLAIVRGLVEAQHGEVSVTNIGSGCRFEVRLPRAA